ncbi:MULTISPECIES: hypothetical protein [unclassified Pedobacter]|uniref:hypothetical protein n=1 Tax=unclassified Pedobacter TaxID=2628915 RepID=UPI00141E0581|nr:MULTISPECIES: hypothetical protein [unclassified Pedobacter]NII81455.1 hypothetical protein [Pedobacter sp. SG908]NMN35459.1 hypothetical protein [Pedobacter sp. SG918]
MAFLDHNGESEFPMSKDKVFEAMLFAIPTIKGLQIESADKLQGRFMVKAGVSLYSWGENIPIQLTEIAENRTKVQITSSPKTGIMFGGAFDMGKNRQNIENILSSTSKILSSENKQKLLQTDIVPFQNNDFHTNPNFTIPNHSSRWYEKTWLTIILCIIFFPVGLYALWKNSSISKGWKIGITVIISLIVLSNLGGNDKIPSKIRNTVEKKEPNPPKVENVNNTQQDVVDATKEEITEKLKAKAKKDWPDDYTTQEFWVNEQINAYEYMLTIEDNSIKAKAQRDWPLDFTTQKFWYNEQIEAQERLK